jgi:hypothetical protein
MAQEEFEILIGPDGKVTVHTKGIKGARCLDFADLFAQILGREESRQLTNEYYETDTETRERVQQKQRR